MRTLIIAGVFLMSAAQAAPVTVDFDSLYTVLEGNTAEGNRYIEDGMRVRDVDGEYELSTWGSAASGYTGSTAMFNNSRGATTELSVAGGGIFDLLSIDLSPLHISLNAEGPELDPDDYVTVTFVTDTGHSQSFDVGMTEGPWVYDEFWEIWYTDAPPPVTTFYFDAGFQGVTSVRWIQNEPGPHQFDNIVANIVPIPAAAWLFMSALAGLGWLRRKPRAA